MSRYLNEDKRIEALINCSDQCPNSQHEWGGHSDEWSHGQSCNWCDAYYDGSDNYAEYMANNYPEFSLEETI